MKKLKYSNLKLKIVSGAARDANGGLHVVNVSAGYGFKPMHVS